MARGGAGGPFRAAGRVTTCRGRRRANAALPGDLRRQGAEPPAGRGEPAVGAGRGPASASAQRAVRWTTSRSRTSSFPGSAEQTCGAAGPRAGCGSAARRCSTRSAATSAGAARVGERAAAADRRPPRRRPSPTVAVSPCAGTGDARFATAGDPTGAHPRSEPGHSRRPPTDPELPGPVPPPLASPVRNAHPLIGLPFPTGFARGKEVVPKWLA